MLLVRRSASVLQPQHRLASTLTPAGGQKCSRLLCHIQSERRDQEAVAATAEPPSTTSAAVNLPPGGRISSFVAATFLAGAIQGPLLDGIHGTVELNHYDSLPVNVLGLHSSVWIPPLLGAFYAVLGSLHVFTDSVALQSPTAVNTMKKLPGGTALINWLQEPRNAEMTRQTLRERTTWPAVALATGALAWLLEVSANLYQNDVPYWQIHAVLAAVTFYNFGTLDGTRQGLALAGLCAVGSPLSEAAREGVL
ncbi:hypothetical protein WJX73_004632 [Symbiochloris irregularis]|uniref:Uncharacterized protein n=1 Tax=Symbiochloris irregularis TaxID=706552 RepID=A0AAW1NZ81_9CHLO